MCYAALIPVAIGAAQGLMQGQAKSAEAAVQSADLKRNAVMLRNAAWDARRRGAYESDLQRIKTQQDIGTQRTAQAAGGGEINTDTNALIQQDTAQFGELDALTIANNAAREAYGYEVQASQNMRNAKMLKANAKTGMLSSVIGGAVGGIGGGGFSSLFGGGGSSGAGAASALSGTSRLNNNQAYS